MDAKAPPFYTHQYQTHQHNPSNGSMVRRGSLSSVCLTPFPVKKTLKRASKSAFGRCKHLLRANKRLKGTPWITIFSSALLHFPPIRCSKWQFNLPSEGVNTFYEQTNGSKSANLDASSLAPITSCRKNQTFHGRFSHCTKTFPLQYA